MVQYTNSYIKHWKIGCNIKKMSFLLTTVVYSVIFKQIDIFSYWGLKDILPLEHLVGIKKRQKVWKSGWDCSSCSFDEKGLASKCRWRWGNWPTSPVYPFLFFLVAAILAASSLIQPHSPVWIFDNIQGIALVTLAYTEAVLKNNYPVH